MDNRAVPRMFGPYVLTRPYGSDPLGGTFLAGTAAGKQLAPYLLIRTFDGDAVDAAALVPAMETAVAYLDEIRGQAVARGAVLGIVDDVPFAGIDHVAGQTLDRLFGLQGAERTPLPPEHALLVAQKILVSLEALRARNEHPDEAAIREAMAGNICRCTGYQRIVIATRNAGGDGGTE